MHIPIIGNGDIKGPLRAAELLQQSGVDGLMIGRPAIGRPWIFREIRHYFETGKILPPPTVEEVVINVREQLHLSMDWKEDEKRGIMEMRRHLAKYFTHLPGFRELKVMLLRAENYQQVDIILEKINEKYGGMQVDYTDVALN
jgi:tRNA-dihydrouridine synthase B